MKSKQGMKTEETSAEWPNNSIFHAPAHIRSSRESNFEPKLVSIGPYYHGRENLKPMEDLKLWCVKEALMKQLLPVTDHSTPFKTGIPQSRNQYIYNVHVEPSIKGGWSLDRVPSEEFMDSGKEARAYYKQKFNHNDVDFVKMLFVDSCFIIRIILSLSQQVQESMAFLDVHIKDVRSDLLLLENQIPLFFIRKVYEFLFPRLPDQKFPHFNAVLEPFLCLDMPWKINHDPISSQDAAHLLDLYWKCSLSPPMYMEPFERELKDLVEQKRGAISELVQRSHPEVVQRIFFEIFRGYLCHPVQRHRPGLEWNLSEQNRGCLSELVQRFCHEQERDPFPQFSGYISGLVEEYRRELEKDLSEQNRGYLSELEKDLSEQNRGYLSELVQRYRRELERELSKQVQLHRRDYSVQEGDHYEPQQTSWAEIHLSKNASMVIANATELQKMAGIKFEKLKDKGHLDVIFSNGIMRMPHLKIDSRQTTLLLNVIAFENCILPNMRAISCYMKLMDALIDSEKDVELLQKCGVIYNTLSSREMAATFFNDIGNFCFIDNNTNPFSGLYKDVQKYYDSSLHRRWASLRQKYFNSPWAIISVVAGATLLILSSLQTFYTIYGYYQQNNRSPGSH